MGHSLPRRSWAQLRSRLTTRVVGPRNFSSRKEQIDRLKNGNAPSISGCWCAGEQNKVQKNSIQFAAQRADGRSECTVFLLAPINKSGRFLSFSHMSGAENLCFREEIAPEQCAALKPARYREGKRNKRFCHSRLSLALISIRARQRKYFSRRFVFQ